VKKWVWIDVRLALAIHDAQLAEHGGADGVRDMGALESALARPQNLAAYGEPDGAAMAASYGFGIAKNHPFVDGNKRTAFVALELFLDLNGYDLVADDAQCVLVMLSVAAGSLSETDLASWIRNNLKAPKRRGGR
jgi:death-on-curing protein